MSGETRDSEEPEVAGERASTPPGGSPEGLNPGGEGIRASHQRKGVTRRLQTPSVPLNSECFSSQSGHLVALVLVRRGSTRSMKGAERWQLSCSGELTQRANLKHPVFEAGHEPLCPSVPCTPPKAGTNSYPLPTGRPFTQRSHVFTTYIMA